MYFPIAICLTVFFTVANLILVPFAYCIHVARLFFQFITSSCKAACTCNFKNFVKFLVGGLFILLVSVFTNMVTFLLTLYTQKMVSNVEYPKIHLSQATLDMFKEAIDDMYNEIYQRRA